MRNNWLLYFTGFVQVIAEGTGSERMLNDCTRLGIVTINVKRLENGAISFFIRLKDVQALRKVVRKHECKCTFHQRIGFPFLLKKSWRNFGFVIGIVLFIAITFLLSNMIWHIEIKGASPKTEHLIQKELDKIGIKRGTFQFLTSSNQTVQNRLMSQIDDITWIGVKLKGTTYSLEVAEKKKEQKKQSGGAEAFSGREGSCYSKNVC